MKSVYLNTEEGDIIWDLSPLKNYRKFSVQISYHKGELVIKWQRRFGNVKCMKIRIFLWQAFDENRIQSAEQLKTRKWKGSVHCFLCGKIEDFNHLLSTCPLAEFIWSFVSEALG
jgi:hypothetical protein